MDESEAGKQTSSSDVERNTSSSDAERQEPSIEDYLERFSKVDLGHQLPDGSLNPEYLNDEIINQVDSLKFVAERLRIKNSLSEALGFLFERFGEEKLFRDEIGKLVKKGRLTKKDVKEWGIGEFDEE